MTAPNPDDRPTASKALEDLQTLVVQMDAPALHRRIESTDKLSQFFAPQTRKNTPLLWLHGNGFLRWFLSLGALAMLTYGLLRPFSTSI